MYIYTNKKDVCMYLVMMTVIVTSQIRTNTHKYNIHVCMYIYIYTQIWTYIHKPDVCMYLVVVPVIIKSQIRTNTHTYIYIYANMYIYTQRNCMYVPRRGASHYYIANTHKHSHITHTHTHIYANMYIYTQRNCMYVPRRGASHRCIAR